jgi:hypothetical protein
VRIDGRRKTSQESCLLGSWWTVVGLDLGQAATGGALTAHGTEVRLRAFRRCTDAIGTAARGYRQPNPHTPCRGGLVSCLFAVHTTSVACRYPGHPLWQGSHPAASRVALCQELVGLSHRQGGFFQQQGPFFQQ